MNEPIFHAPEAKEDEASRAIKEGWALYQDSLPERVRVLFDRFHLCDMAWPRTTTRCSCSSSRRARLCSSPMPGRVCTATTVSASSLASVRCRRRATSSWGGRRDYEVATSGGAGVALSVSVATIRTSDSGVRRSPRRSAPDRTVPGTGAGSRECCRPRTRRYSGALACPERFPA